MIADSNRTDPLTIFGPRGTYQVVQALTIVVPALPFTVQIIELDGGESHTLPDGLELRSLQVEHRMSCLAYSFSRQRAPRFNADHARALGVPVTRWSELQAGNTVDVDGRPVTPDQVLGGPRRGLKVGFVTDTRVTEQIPDFVRGADLLICEGTYGDPELRERARQRGHMVFDDAATIARAGNVRQLILTHFSPSMLDPENFVHHARAIFSNSTIGQQHETITLAFDDE